MAPTSGSRTPGEGTVSEIEASSGTVIRTIHVGGEPEGVSSDGTHVWVTNGGAGGVSEIEASSGTVIRTIHVGDDPDGVSSDGTHVWVTNVEERSVRSKRPAGPSSARSPSASALWRVLGWHPRLGHERAEKGQ